MATEVALWIGKPELRGTQVGPVVVPPGVPPSTVFHTPPLPPVAYMIAGFLGSIATSLIRPLYGSNPMELTTRAPFRMPFGPSSRQRDPSAGGMRSRAARALVMTFDTWAFCACAGKAAS